MRYLIPALIVCGVLLILWRMSKECPDCEASCHDRITRMIDSTRAATQQEDSMRHVLRIDSLEQAIADHASARPTIEQATTNALQSLSGSDVDSFRIILHEPVQD